MVNYNFKLEVSEDELEEYLNYGLSDKVRLSLLVIREFVRVNGLDKMFISSSFGKDSVVLIDLVRSLYPEIPIVYLDTGVEPECCRELAESYDNVITLTPKKDIEQVTHEYGYMIPQGKDKASAIEKIASLLSNGGIFVISIDKNQSGFIDMGTRKIRIYPDNPIDTAEYISKTNLNLVDKFETEYAYVLVSQKPSPAGNGGNTDKV